MRIAQIIPSLLPTGPVNVALDLHALLLEKGHEASIFYFDDKPDGKNTLRAQRISFKQKRNWEQFDVVHSHGLRPDIYVRRNLSRMPHTVSTLHNYVKPNLVVHYNKWVATVFTPIWNWACAQHKVNVVLSDDMKTYYQSFWRNKNLHVIPNTRKIHLSENIERIQKVKEWANGRKILGAVSTLTPGKGVDEVFPFLKANSNWCYAHVGAGDYLVELQQLAEKEGVQSQILWLGHQDMGWEFAKAFDVFIMPSHTEGFPLSLIEAVQLNVPVVTSDITVFKEIFTEEEVPKFALGNLISLSSAIQKAYSDKEHQTKRANERFKNCYSPEIVVQKYIRIYQGKY